MKKLFACLLSVSVFLLLLTGCSNENAGRKGSNQTGVADVLASGMAAADTASSETAVPASSSADPETRQEGLNEGASAPAAVSESAVLSTAEGLDIDLTILSSTLVYSEVYQMMMDPDLYIGKTIRMSGIYTVYHDVPNDLYYHACIITDATACCSQGIEFVLADAQDRVFPDDYPMGGTEITVTGVFDTYMDGGRLYCTLRNAVFG